MTIEAIRNAERIALSINSEGFYLNFSGGKDSQVIYHLAQMSGVKFTAHMALTSVDPPELLRFVRRNYPDVILHKPVISMYDLIKKKHMLPLMNARFCCAILKETGGMGYMNILGIRKAESAKRAKRNELEITNHKYSNSLDQFNIDQQTVMQCVNGKDRLLFNPIIDWSTSEVWGFIRKNNIQYCELYDKGYDRIGCMLCPIARAKIKQLDIKRYPGVVKKYKEAIQYLIDNYNYGDQLNHNVNDIFNWWVSNKSMSEFKADKQQLRFENDYARGQ